MAAGEEFIIGECISRHETASVDVSRFPHPAWSELVNLLNNEDIKRMGILFCGIAGSDGKVGSTGKGIVTKQDVLRTPFSYHNSKDIELLRDMSMDPDNTEVYAQTLLGLNVLPEYITGIVVWHIE